MRRRGRDVGLAGVFVERDRELAVLSEAFAAAQRGVGATIVIQAPVGKGKTRLLTTAGDLARQAGMQVLGAVAGKLELEFPLGTAAQLFEPRWTAIEPEERARLLAGPARTAETLLDSGFFAAAPRTVGQSYPLDQAYPLIHGLFWVTSNLAGSGPLAILVDDVHWADPVSLRFLSYLATRLAELPIVLIVTIRTGEPAADPQALATLSAAASALTLRPVSLSQAGIETIVRSELPEADAEFVAACTRVTHGNPLLLRELLAQLHADGRPPTAATAQGLSDLAPEAIVSSVVSRLDGMAPEARALACAVSLLGEGASLRHASRLAGLEEAAAADAADRLAAIGMLRPGTPLSFVHPMIRSAVAASMSPLARGQAHRRAAEILGADGASADVIAVHLLHAPPGEDPKAIGILRTAAHRALGGQSTTGAVRLLERALAEHPAPETRAEILAELGQAEARDGLPQATERLSEAIRLSGSPRRRAELALVQSRALYADARYPYAAEVLDDAILDAGSGALLAGELEAAYVSAASLVPARAGDAWARGEDLLGRLSDSLTATERAAVAHIVLAASRRGDRRPDVRQLVDLAWDEGELLRDETADGPSWPMLTGALLFADELERGLELCDDALGQARQAGSRSALATVNYCRAWTLYEQGQIAAAIVCAKAAMAARPDDSSTQVRTASGAVALCQIQLGQLEAAEAVLASIDHPEVRDSAWCPFLLDVRAQLRLAQHRPEEALQDAQHAGEALLASSGSGDNPGVVAWRSTAALAHLALGQAGPAAELAAAELRLARDVGVTRVVIRDLRVLGLARAGEAGLELLTEAVQTGEHYPTRLEYLHALVDLGAARRRGNQRAAARPPLRRALELSLGAGARAIAQRARTELAASGARPRREQLSGLKSLTASQRRVAELVAQGLTTRQMAESLFITPKTVEFHLRNIYRQLDISSREELAEALHAERAA